MPDLVSFETSASFFRFQLRLIDRTMPACPALLARVTDGITAKVFSMFNELAIEAVRSGKEEITDDDVETWKPALEREAVFA